jgi:hypothetical protein
MQIETKNTTYRDLIQKLQDLPDERLDDNVVILDNDNGEFFAADGFHISEHEHDALDEGHFYITTV